MSKKKWSIILAIFFLVQSIVSSSVLSFECSSLNPPTKIDAAYSDHVIKNIYDAICMGVFLYELDTIARLSKEEIKKKYPALLLNSGVSFELANMDLGKKGWTRYYPFLIGDKSFIMRIFLTSEKVYQHSMLVLYEGAIANPAVTFQILPSINDTVSSCKSNPHRVRSSSAINHSL